MPYIKVERDEHDKSSNTKFDYKLCGFHIPSGGCHNNQILMRRHVEDVHADEWKKTLDQNEKYMNEFESFRESLRKKYPLALRSIGSFFKPLPLPPRRMWKCPDCGDIMSPHERYHHDSNRDRYCKPKETMK